MGKVIGVVFLIVGIVAALGGYFWMRGGSPVSQITQVIKRGEPKPCTLTPKPREFKSEPYYNGPLIDDHVHMPIASKMVSTVAKQMGFGDMPVFEGELTPHYLICLFESEGIKQAFGFHMLSKFSQSSQHIEEIEKSYPGKIVHFLMPPPIHNLLLQPSAIDEVLNENQGLFKGFGEIGFEKGTFTQASPLDPQFLQMFEIAQKHKLVVMMHPRGDQQDEVEQILTKFTDVTFLLHGGSNQEWILDVMKNHQNVYYSLDANMTSLYGFEKRHEHKALTKQEWLTFIRGNFDNQLNKALQKWKDKIEAHPDRFTWGTDRWYGWSFDQDVGGILEEFGRSFIGRLDPSVQEKFAYKNAERLLKER